VSNVLNLQEGETIVKIVNFDDVTSEKELLFITKDGYGSKSTTDFFKNATKNRAIIGIKLGEGDEVLSFNIVNPTDDLVLITKLGKGLRFPVANVNMTKSAAKGVFVYRSADDKVVSSIVVSEAEQNNDIVVGFEFGGIKKFNIADLKTKKRNQVGLIITKTNKEDGFLVDGTLVAEDENVLLLSLLGESGLIKPHDIKSVSRTAVGIRKGIRLKDNDKVIKVMAIKELTDTEEETNEEEMTVDTGIELSETETI
jgi:DNA gyrase subunit A